MFIETSAKAGHNVKTLFRKIAQALPGMEREGEAAGGANQSELSVFIIGETWEEEKERSRHGKELGGADHTSIRSLPFRNTVIDVSITPTNTTPGEGGCSC